MIVHSRMAEPVKVNGKWTVVVKEFDEEIPDRGRHTLLCNKCEVTKDYPACRSWCPIEKGRIEREAKEAARKAEERKAEFNLLVGLVKDGLLKVEDAAPRIGMTAEEFETAMGQLEK